MKNKVLIHYSVILSSLILIKYFGECYLSVLLRCYLIPFFAYQLLYHTEYHVIRKRSVMRNSMQLLYNSVCNSP